MTSAQDYRALCALVERIDKKAAKYMRGPAKKLKDFYKSRILAGAFPWDCTPQGYNYWYLIDRLLNQKRKR